MMYFIIEQRGIHKTYILYFKYLNHHNPNQNTISGQFLLAFTYKLRANLCFSVLQRYTFGVVYNPNCDVCFFIGYNCDGTSAAEEYWYGGNCWGSNMYPCSTAQLSKKVIASNSQRQDVARGFATHRENTIDFQLMS